MKLPARRPTTCVEAGEGSLGSKCVRSNAAMQSSADRHGSESPRCSFDCEGLQAAGLGDLPCASTDNRRVPWTSSALPSSARRWNSRRQVPCELAARPRLPNSPRGTMRLHAPLLRRQSMGHRRCGSKHGCRIAIQPATRNRWQASPVSRVVGLCLCWQSWRLHLGGRF